MHGLREGVSDRAVGTLNSIDTGASLSGAASYIANVLQGDVEIRRRMASISHAIVHLLEEKRYQQQVGCSAPRQWAGPGSFPAGELKLGMVDIEQKVFSACDGSVGTEVWQVNGDHPSAFVRVGDAVATFWHDAGSSLPRQRDELALCRSADGHMWSAVGSGRSAFMDALLLVGSAVVTSFHYDWRVTHTARVVTDLSGHVTHGTRLTSTRYLLRTIWRCRMRASRNAGGTVPSFEARETSRLERSKRLGERVFGSADEVRLRPLRRGPC